MEEVHDAAHKQEDLRPAGSTRVMLLLPETSSQTQQKSVLKLIRLCSLNNIRLLKPLHHQTHSLLFILIFYLFIYLFGCVGSDLQMWDSPYLWWDLAFSAETHQLWGEGSAASGLGDLTFPTRDRTHVHCISRWTLNHWTPREVPGHSLEGIILLGPPCVAK